MAAPVEAHIRRAAHLWTKWTLINSLRLFWIGVVLWCEIGVFLWSIVGCRWPDKALDSSAPRRHVLLVADPQILDARSYPGRPKWLMSLTQYIVDFNLRKSWSTATAGLRPHVVVFMGDMMDNGRVPMDETEYTLYYNRFKSIFRLHPSIPVHYLPGNHDVDLRHSVSHSPLARNRYQAHFGVPNKRVEIANHTLVLLDAPGLVEEDYRRHTAQISFDAWRGTKGGPVEFLKNLTAHRPRGPIVLFSHIPLARPDRSSCGPRRERGTIHPGVGHGYQNLVLRETSSFVLENVRPSVVFSGDDHDYCEYVHVLADGSSVREVTVRSFSMAMGIKRPGFQLLSLAADASPSPASLPPSSVTLADAACLLPNQIRIYTHGYAPLGILTVLLLLIFNYINRRHRSSSRSRHRQDKATQASAPGWFSPNMSGLITHRQGLPRAPMQLTDPLATGDEEGQEWHDMSSRFSETNHPGRDDAYGPPQDHEPSRGALLELLGPCCAWCGLPRAWYCRAARDLCQVAWAPVWIYISISLWVFWR